ncbi:MAG TPA: hypothetical protein VF487_02740 [Chitinophagaceae bacterium]
MKKIILRVTESALAIDLIDVVLAAIRPQDYASENIYLKTMNGTINICLS